MGQRMGTHTITPLKPDDKLRELEAITRQLAANHDVLVEIRDLLHDFAKILLDSKFRYGRACDRFSRPPNWRRA